MWDFLMFENLRQKMPKKNSQKRRVKTEIMIEMMIRYQSIQQLFVSSSFKFHQYLIQNAYNSKAHVTRTQITFSKRYQNPKPNLIILKMSNPSFKENFPILLLKELMICVKTQITEKAIRTTQSQHAFRMIKITVVFVGNPDFYYLSEVGSLYKTCFLIVTEGK